MGISLEGLRGAAWGTLSIPRLELVAAVCVIIDESASAARLYDNLAATSTAGFLGKSKETEIAQRGGSESGRVQLRRAGC